MALYGKSSGVLIEEFLLKCCKVHDIERKGDGGKECCSECRRRKPRCKGLMWNGERVSLDETRQKTYTINSNEPINILKSFLNS